VEARFHRAISIFFIMVVLALGLATIVSAPLSFDGAFFFFQVLDTHQFAAYHGRLINVALQLPVMLATRYTESLPILRASFSIAYTAIPLIGLIVSWMICKARRPSLFIWPAISICMACLPGQFSFHSEAIAAVTLLWPALLAVLLGASATVLSLVGITSLAAACSHPCAALILAFIVAVSIGFAIARTESRRASLGFTFALGALLIARSLIRLDPYEGQALGLQTIVTSFSDSVLGWPLVAICFVFAAALSLFLQGKLGPQVYLVGMLSLAGVALFGWAVRPTSWAACLDYRYWVAPVSLPFMAGATIEVLWMQKSAEPELQRTRRHALSLIGTIFFLVLSIQSLEWASASRRLTDVLRNSDSGCISRKSIASIRGYALDNWPVTVYAVELQSRKPRTLLLPNGLACGLFALDGDAILVDLTNFQFVRHHGQGWFDFDGARSRASNSRR